MDAKEARRKTIKRKTIIKSAIIISCVLIVAVIAGVFIFGALRQDTNRVFSGIGTSITLYADGTFNAFLPHDVRISGTYTEIIKDGVVEVLFSYNGNIEVGIIRSNILSLPPAWEPDCICWHNLRLRLR
ncbi:MAG: hypothetical protein FWC07_02230 [Defluviitaleaceae bacterium]|nr:hypothetical protein [Defluviitaleaceae bacterium]